MSVSIGETSITGPVLAIDTHGTVAGLAGLALYCGAGIRHQTGHFGRDLDANLAVYTADCLTNWGYTFNDLKGLLAVCGPGNFTGLRIGLAYIRGLGLGLDIPVWGVSAIEAKVGATAMPAWAAIPARRREPDRSWWVQYFDSALHETHRSMAPNYARCVRPIEELDRTAMQALADKSGRPFPDDIEWTSGANNQNYAPGALAWWRMARPVLDGAPALFVRSALR